jgi:hypothetical protein
MGSDQVRGCPFARPMPANDLLERALGRRPAGAVGFSASTVAQLDTGPIDQRLGWR